MAKVADLLPQTCKALVANSSRRDSGNIWMAIDIIRRQTESKKNQQKKNVVHTFIKDNITRLPR